MPDKEELISLAEYAKIYGIDPFTVRQRALQGAYGTARKIGRNWVIDKNEPHVDHRITSGLYVKNRMPRKENDRENHHN